MALASWHVQCTLFTLCWSTLSPTHFSSILRNSKPTFNYKIDEIFRILQISGDHRRQIHIGSMFAQHPKTHSLKSIVVRATSRNAHTSHFVCVLPVHAILSATSAERVDFSCVRRFHFVCSFHSCSTVGACCVWLCSSVATCDVGFVQWPRAPLCTNWK